MKTTGIRKVIAAKYPDLVVEHWGESFDKVIAKYRGDKSVKLWLQRYGETDFGTVFQAEALIGGSASTKDDYYRAYDKVV